MCFYISKRSIHGIYGNLKMCSRTFIKISKLMFHKTHFIKSQTKHTQNKRFSLDAFTGKKRKKSYIPFDGFLTVLNP